MEKRAKHDFWRGYASILNLFPVRRRAQFTYRSRSASEAFRADWEKLGADMKAAMAIEHEKQAAQRDEEPAVRR